MGKGILDRNWVTIIQAKAKYFASVTQYQRGLVDDAAGKHGDALARFTLAETNAKEANKIALSFASLFVNQLSPNLPPDAGPSLQELTKAHLAVCTTQKNDAQKANDLIYNAILPSPETLPVVDKTSATTPITIQEVYGNPDVQKVIGQDIFIKLVPLSVHESASVYSEEKAKFVRSEVEKVDVAEGEVKSVLDSLGVREGLSRYKSMVEGSIGREEEVPLEVRRWRDDIRVIEEREPVDRLLSQLASLKANVQAELDGISRDLEIESKDCEAMRVKYDSWSQEPSASLTKNIRQDLKSHSTALEAAGVSDEQVVRLWGAVNTDIGLLLSEELDVVFREGVENSSSQGESLLDLDVSSEMKDEEEKRQIEQLVNEIEDRLSGLHKISKERDQVLRDLKEKVIPVSWFIKQRLIPFIDSNRRRLTSVAPEPSKHRGGDHPLRERAGEVPPVSTTLGLNSSPPAGDVAGANRAVEETPRSCQSRTRCQEMGGTRKAQEGHYQTIFPRKRWVHGSQGWYCVSVLGTRSRGL